MEASSAWRELAAYVTLRRSADSLVETDQASVSVRPGMALIARYGFPALFGMIAEAVAENDEVKLSIGVDGLAYLLSSNDALSTLSEHTATLRPSLILALGSHCIPVRMLALRFLRDVVTGKVSFAQLPRSAIYEEDLLEGVVAELGVADDSISVADMAADVLLAAAGGRVKVGTGSLRRPIPIYCDSPPPSASHLTAVTSCVSAFLAVNRTNSIVFTRVLALIARIAGARQEACMACMEAGIVDTLLAAAKDDTDPLLQMVVIDLLPTLAKCACGAELLAQSTFAYLLSMAGVPSGNNTSSPAADPLLGNNALSAVADIYVNASAHADLSAVSMRALILPGLYAVLQEACEESTAAPDRAAAAMYALRAVCACDRSAVHELCSGTWEGGVREWLELGGSGQPDLRLACLATLGGILQSLSSRVSQQGPVSPAEQQDYCALFDRLGPCGGYAMDSMDVLRACLTNPADPDARYAGYGVLSALVSLPGTWGLRRVFGAPGMLNHLLDRAVEHSKEGKEWKFGVVQAALGNAEVGILGEDTVARLAAFVSRGAFAADMEAAGVTHAVL